MTIQVDMMLRMIKEKGCMMLDCNIKGNPTLFTEYSGLDASTSKTDPHYITDTLLKRH
jgi:hypothetical protein